MLRQTKATRRKARNCQLVGYLVVICFKNDKGTSHAEHEFIIVVQCSDALTGKTKRKLVTRKLLVL